MHVRILWPEVQISFIQLNASQIVLAMMIKIEINNLPKTKAIDVYNFSTETFSKTYFYLRIIMLHVVVV